MPDSRPPTSDALAVIRRRTGADRPAGDALTRALLLNDRLALVPRKPFVDDEDKGTEFEMIVGPAPDTDGPVARVVPIRAEGSKFNGASLTLMTFAPTVPYQPAMSWEDTKKALKNLLDDVRMKDWDGFWKTAMAANLSRVGNLAPAELREHTERMLGPIRDEVRLLVAVTTVAAPEGEDGGEGENDGKPDWWPPRWW
jgi:hypothetical protein